jgi:ABC-2 type transport system permease protein
MAHKEWRQLFRDPKTQRIIFLSPVVQLILFGYAVNTDVRRVATYVVDHDRTTESRLLLDAFTSGDWFRIVGTSDRTADLASALDRGDAIVGIQIGAGFARDLAAGRSPPIQILVDGSTSNTATVAQAYALRIVRSFAQSVLAVRAGDAALAAGIDLRARAWYNPGLSSRVYNIPAVIGVIVMLMCLLLTSMAVVRERELGTLDQLLVSPLTPSELMLGKTLPVALVAMIQLGLVTTVGLLWFRIPFEGAPASLLLAALLFILAGLAFGLLISTLSSTQQEAFLAMFLFVLPAIILSGFLYPVETMPEIFQWITLLNPLRHFLHVVRALFLKGAGLMELWPEYLALAITAATVLAVAAHRFRRSIA